MIDGLQSEIVHLLFLFYTSIGVIQRDAPPLNPADPKHLETEQSLRIENNISELIGSIITTKNKITERIRALEEMYGKKAKRTMGPLAEESSLLDGEIREQIKEMERELPFFKEFLEKKIRGLDL